MGKGPSGGNLFDDDKARRRKKNGRMEEFQRRASRQSWKRVFGRVNFPRSEDRSRPWVRMEAKHIYQVLFAHLVHVQSSSSKRFICSLLTASSSTLPLSVHLLYESGVNELGISKMASRPVSRFGGRAIFFFIRTKQVRPF